MTMRALFHLRHLRSFFARPARRSFAGASIVASIAASAACGGQEPAKGPETANEEPPQREAQGPKLQMSAELGSIDPKATQATFDRLQSKLNACYRAGLGRIEYLEGDAQFFLRVGQDGRAKYAYLEGSTIGDRDAEKCMVDALSAATWPKPEGGEAEVRNSIGFDAPGDVRAPVEWSADRLAEAIGKSDEKIKKCKAGASGVFKATAYVLPDGKRGRFQSIGMTPPNKDGIDKIDCLLDVVRDMKIPSPGSYAAKVTFVL